LGFNVEANYLYMQYKHTHTFMHTLHTCMHAHTYMQYIHTYDVNYFFSIANR